MITSIIFLYFKAKVLKKIITKVTTLQVIDIDGFNFQFEDESRVKIFLERDQLAKNTLFFFFCLKFFFFL
jgi:hypothetical protein